MGDLNEKIRWEHDNKLSRNYSLGWRNARVERQIPVVPLKRASNNEQQVLKKKKNSCELRKGQSNIINHIDCLTVKDLEAKMICSHMETKDKTL